jgi:hypothetical protein
MYVLDAQGRPFSCKLEYDGWTDRRLNDSRETALSVKILTEKASKACSRNGDGYELLMDFYVREASWYSFTPAERDTISRTAKAFRCYLCAERFVDACGHPRRSCRRKKG